MELHEEDVQALHVLEEINYGCAVPFAFKSIVKMGIPDILAAAGPGASLTAQQIADKLPHKSAEAARKLGRILRLVAHKGIFTETESPTSTSEARYALTKVSRLLVTGAEIDLKPFTLLSQKTEDFAPLNYLREIVEEDANPYKLAFGWDTPIYTRPRMR